MRDLAPCLFVRKTVPKVWGGGGLAEEFGFTAQADLPIGETWEVYDRPDGSSPVRGSSSTLADLVAEHGAALLGDGVAPAWGGRFPLAVKFVDAGQALSVQVHPDDPMAAAEGDSGKAEAWVVLRVAPGGTIRCGVRAPVTAAAFRAAVDNGEVVALLDEFTPAVGDVVHVPAGTVHAIGPGVLVYEVQQNSDITYRLFDYGRDRPLHVERGLRAARLAPGAHRRSGLATEGRALLVDDPAFALWRMPVRGATPFDSGGVCALMTAIRGGGRVRWGGSAAHDLSFAAGDTVLVPAGLGTIEVDAAADLLVAQPRRGK